MLSTRHIEFAYSARTNFKSSLAHLCAVMGLLGLRPRAHRARPLPDNMRRFPALRKH